MMLSRPRNTHRLVVSAVALLIVFCAADAYALHVTAQASARQVRVGEKVTVTVTGVRSDSLGDPQFAGAGVLAGSAWIPGGQVTQSPQIVGAEMRKTWQFELTAAAPDSTRVSPVVYLGNGPALGQRADSILGAPILIIIMPPPGKPLWPWVVGAIAAIGISVFLVMRLLGRRDGASFERPAASPLQEALEMLESARVNRRADRIARYMTDLEHLLNGYVARRQGVALTGKTPAEIVSIAKERVRDGEALDELNALLQCCARSRFGGVHPGFETLTELEERTRRTLEHLDCAWV